MAASPSTSSKLADNQKGVLKAFQQAAAVQQEAAHVLRDSFKKKIRILAPLVYTSTRDAERRLDAATRAADEAKKRLEEERKAREEEKKEANKKLEATTSQYETQRRALTARLAKVKQENEESTKEFQKLLEERRQETLRERAKMEKQLAAARGEAVKLREELERSVKEVEKGRKERAVIQQKLSDAELRIGKLQKEIESLRENGGGAKGSLGSQTDLEVSTRITNAVPLNSSSSLLDSIAFGESLLSDGRSSLDTTVAQPAEPIKKATTRGVRPATAAPKRAPTSTVSRTTATRASARAQPWAAGTARTTRTRQPPATTTSKRSTPEPKKRARPRGTSQRQNLPTKFVPEGQSPPRKRPARSTRAQAVNAITEATPIARRTRSQRTLVGLRSTVIK